MPWKRLKSQAEICLQSFAFACSFLCKNEPVIQTIGIMYLLKDPVLRLKLDLLVVRINLGRCSQERNKHVRDNDGHLAHGNRQFNNLPVGSRIITNTIQKAMYYKH